MNVKVNIKTLVYTPTFYVAWVIAAVIGGMIGGLTGLISGGIIGHEYVSLTQCSPVLLGYELAINHLNIIAGAVAGAVVGAVSVGIGTCAVLNYLVYNNNKLSNILTPESIQPVVKYAFKMSLIINAGTVVGALIGGFASPPFGPIVGAVVGFILLMILSMIHLKHTN